MLRYVLRPPSELCSEKAKDIPTEKKPSAKAEGFEFRISVEVYACFFFILFKKMRANRVCSTPIATGTNTR